MSTTFADRFRKFISTGITPAMNDLEARRIRLLNIFYVMGSCVFFASTIQTFIVDGKQEGLIVLGLFFVFEIGLVFLLLHKTKIAQFYLLLISNLSLFLIENHYGPEAGTFLFYFPFMLIIAFLVDFKKFFDAAFHLTLTIFAIVVGIPLRNEFLYHPFPADVNESSFIFCLLFSSMLIAAIALIILRMTYVQSQEFDRQLEERKQTEESMKVSLKEKETLIAEVHHRVKNNLAVITSLLNLQMNQAKNDYTKDVLLESKNRVSSMALIHQKLYQHSNVEQIDFDSYAKELVEEIKHSYPRSSTEKIDVQLDAEHLPLSLTKAVPCGLILNELLSNCYKHAFPQGKNGKIIIRFFSMPEISKRFVLEVEDDGIGIPTGFEMSKQESLGMTIIHSLAGQLDGKFEIMKKEKGGTFCRVVFS